MILSSPEPLSDAALAQTFSSAWSSLGRSVPAGLHATLLAAWSEPGRHYHDPSHLRECLAWWQYWQGHFDQPGEVALALWFHDAVYDPRRTDNELQSATWAARALVSAGVATDVAQRVYDLVMATQHRLPVTGPDAQWVVDIDLAILGSPPERFERYDKDVAREYDWVPNFRYRSGRIKVLRDFLERPRLYHHEAPAQLLDAQARANLKAALSRLTP